MTVCSSHATVAITKNGNSLDDLLAIRLYKKQINYLVNLSQKDKKDYFQEDMPHSSPSKTFLKLL